MSAKQNFTWPWAKKKMVYSFKEGTTDDFYLLGKKGADLSEMFRLDMPVPNGFILTTEACRDILDQYQAEIGTKIIDASTLVSTAPPPPPAAATENGQQQHVLIHDQPLHDVFAKNIKALEKNTGKHFGKRYIAGSSSKMTSSSAAAASATATSAVVEVPGIGASSASSSPPVTKHDAGVEIAEFFRIKEAIEPNTSPVPLLLAVRSSSTVNAPGMMETVLNVGINDEIVQLMAEATGNEHWALDTYRRFLRNYGVTVLGVDSAKYDAVLADERIRRKIDFDTQLSVEAIRNVIEAFQQIATVPEDPMEQLTQATKAVALSWDSERCKAYRTIELATSDREGTAVVIQTMVHGTWSVLSGAGRISTRNGVTGEAFSMTEGGEFLSTATGEDLSCSCSGGGRVPESIEMMRQIQPAAWTKLMSLLPELEKRYKDMQDIEFTVEHGQLYLLQTRCGKRTAKACVHIAAQMVKEGMLTEKEALMRVSPRDVGNFLNAPMLQIPSNEERASTVLVGGGISVGAAHVSVGKLVFSTREAVRCRARGEACILCMDAVTPADIWGLHAAEGVIMLRGNRNSHVVAILRQMDKPCLIGRDSLRLVQTVPSATTTATATGADTSSDIVKNAAAAVAKMTTAVKDAVAASGLNNNTSESQTTTDKMWTLRAVPHWGLTSVGNGTDGAAVEDTEVQPKDEPKTSVLDPLFVDIQKHIRSMGTADACCCDIITLDGCKGHIYMGDNLTLTPHGRESDIDSVLHWAEDFKKMHIASFVENGAHSTREACLDGVEGIDFFDTQKMFTNNEENLLLVRTYLLSDKEEQRIDCIHKMHEAHKEEFLSMLRTASNRPVGMSLLHHSMKCFFPCQWQNTTEFDAMIVKMAPIVKLSDERCRERVEGLLNAFPSTTKHEQYRQHSERLDNVFPRLNDNIFSATKTTFLDLAYMQASAFTGAAIRAAQEGIAVHPHCHIPHVHSEFSAERIAAVVYAAHMDTCKRDGFDLPCSIGCIIDTPHSLMIADTLVNVNHINGILFSLDQLTELYYGLTRSDAKESMKRYSDNRDIEFNPFESMDVSCLGMALFEAVGKCRAVATDTGKDVDYKFKIGARGQLCGDKDSVAFLEQLGVDYITCPLSKIAMAKVAAAHAHIEWQSMATMPRTGKAAAGARVIGGTTAMFTPPQHAATAIRTATATHPRLSNRPNAPVATHKTSTSHAAAKKDFDLAGTFKEMFKGFTPPVKGGAVATTVAESEQHRTVA